MQTHAALLYLVITQQKIKEFSNCTAIAAGSCHAAAINDGCLYEWGDKYGGEAEHDVTSPRKTKKKVEKASCGELHILCLAKWGLTSKLWAYSIGNGERGQLGNGKNESCNKWVECKIPSLGKDFQKAGISAGKNHSALLTQEGAVYTFGCNRFGQLGYFTEEDYSSTPQKVSWHGKEIR